MSEEERDVQTEVATGPATVTAPTPAASAAGSRRFHYRSHVHRLLESNNLELAIVPAKAGAKKKNNLGLLDLETLNLITMGKIPSKPRRSLRNIDDSDSEKVSHIEEPSILELSGHDPTPEVKEHQITNSYDDEVSHRYQDGPSRWDQHNSVSRRWNEESQPPYSGYHTYVDTRSAFPSEPEHPYASSQHMMPQRSFPPPPAHPYYPQYHRNENYREYPVPLELENYNLHQRRQSYQPQYYQQIIPQSYPEVCPDFRPRAYQPQQTPSTPYRDSFRTMPVPMNSPVSSEHLQYPEMYQPPSLPPMTPFPTRSCPLSPPNLQVECVQRPAASN
ncbi:hypothetical protein HK096_002798, partial [Nowakowskiella sp. JEL0078]